MRGVVILLAVALLAAVVRVAAAAEVAVDFDGYPPGTTITDQYRNLGGTDAGVVLQRSPSGVYGPAVNVFDAGGGAHSGTHVADIYDSRVEFPWALLWGFFPSGSKTLVRAFVGSTAGSATHVVTLTGYDVGGSPIAGAKQSATVVGNGSYQTQLQIADALGRIAYFQIGFEGPGLVPVLGVDDIGFDVPVVPPAPNFGLTVDLSATLLGPISVARGTTSQFGAKVLVNRFAGSHGPLLTSTSGLPAGVTPIISVDDAANPSTFIVKLEATPSATIAVNETFTFTATPGSPAVGTVPHSVDIPFTVLDNYDLAVTGIEVTQGIQRSGDLPPASPPGSAVSVLAAYDGMSLVTKKTTVARVFTVVAAPLGATVNGARLRLHGFRAGGDPLPGSPLERTLGPLTNGNPNGVTQAERASAPTTAFVLPPEWTAPGKIDLKADIVPPSVLGGGAVECGAVSCQGNNSYVLSGIPFYDTGFLNVGAIRLAVDGQPFPGFPDEILSAFQQLIPLADTQLRRADDWRAEFDVTKVANATQNRDLFPFTCWFPPGTCPPGAKLGPVSCAWCDAEPPLDKLLLASILDFHSGEEGCDDEYAEDRHSYCFDAIVGMIDDRGIANPTCVTYGSCVAGLSKGGRTINGIGARSIVSIRRPLTSVAHELGHGFGLQHASGGCGGGANGQTATDWADSYGTIRGVGYDRRDQTVKVTGNAPPRHSDPPKGAPAGAWYDFMSYCADFNAEIDFTQWFPWVTTDAWISTVNWDFMHGVLRSLDIHHSAVVRPEVARTPLRAPATLRVRGYLDGAQVVLTQIGPGTGEVSPPGPGPGPYRLVLRDAQDGSLGETPMLVESTEGHGAAAMFLAADVPLAGTEPGALPAALAAVEVVTDAGLQVRVPRSPNPPSVRIRGPRRGAHVGRGRMTTIRWRAADADGDALTTTVEYSMNDGVTWSVLWKGSDRKKIRVPSGLLSRSRKARLRVRVSDSFDETASVSPRFVAVGRPPTVRILAPVAGAVPADEPLTLAATAHDDRQLALPDDAIRWLVDKKRVGRGTALSVGGLRPGRHMVRAVVRAAGRKGRDVVRIRVVPAS